MLRLVVLAFDWCLHRLENSSNELAPLARGAFSLHNRIRGGYGMLRDRLGVIAGRTKGDRRRVCQAGVCATLARGGANAQPRHLLRGGGAFSRCSWGLE
jgi:hypothetical protein